MIIANPIYDITFKRIMTDENMAKFLIGTIIDCEIISLVTNMQEHTYEADEDEKKSIALFRMDFSATIRTKEEGEKKVIIELQKAIHEGDIKRFRRYLGYEYSRSELPIISIYILGFNLEVDSPAFIISPECFDLRTNEKLTVRDAFVKKLTHTAYFIQTKRIKPEYNTKLEKLLSIFEQSNFIGNSHIKKSYSLIEVEPGLKAIVNTLQHIAADTETKKELDREEYYHQFMEDMFGESNREKSQMKNTIAEKEQTIAQKEQAIALKEQAITQIEYTIAQKEQALKNMIIMLHKNGTPIDEIAKLANLSKEEILTTIQETN